jgi:lysylphosphatidylglycerol synthetase-like protein (DUF2156 family)
MQILRDPAYQRYLKRFVPIMLIYVIGIGVASSTLETKTAPSAYSIAISLIPGLAMAGVIWAMGRLVVELEDEYLRMLEVRKALIATSVTLAVASTLGVLELFTTIPATPIFFIFPLWCIGLGVGQLVNKVRGL